MSSGLVLAVLVRSCQLLVLRPTWCILLSQRRVAASGGCPLGLSGSLQDSADAVHASCVWVYASRSRPQGACTLGVRAGDALPVVGEEVHRHCNVGWRTELMKHRCLSGLAPAYRG